MRRIGKAHACVAEGVMPYLNGEILPEVNCSGINGYDNCISYTPGKAAAIQRFRDALEKARGGK